MNIYGALSLLSLFISQTFVTCKKYSFIKNKIYKVNVNNTFRPLRLYNSYRASNLKAQCGMSRVVCTGLGVVNGVGIGIDEFWNNLKNGFNSINKITKFDTTDMACQIGSEINNKQFNPSDFYKNKKDVTRNDECTHYAVAAARLALEDSKLDTKKVDTDKIGVIIGSGIGGLSFLEKEMKTLIEKGHKKVSPFLIPGMIANTPSGVVAIENNINGIALAVLSACSTSGNAIGEAFNYIRHNGYDAIICGGTEASITPLSFAGFNALRALCMGYNNNPKKGCRPFDLKRSGFVMGEGAGILILESYEHAIKRNANIYGEILAYSSKCDAYHITAPEPNGSGLVSSIKTVLKDGNVKPTDVKYINAHGTSTALNDKIETKAFKTVFGDYAYNLHISSTKSMTGHCIGATGAIEAIACLKTMQTNTIPPTINYEYPDPECNLNYTPNKAFHSKQNIDISLSTNLGFGGHNTALLFKKIEK